MKDEKINAGPDQASLAFDQMPEPVFAVLVPLLDPALIEVTPVVCIETVYIVTLIGRI